MYIKGVGRINKKAVLPLLTSEGKKALKDGTMSSDEAAAIYKLSLVKKYSKIGSIENTFAACYDRIPDGITDALTPEQIAALVDSYYSCYGDGIREGERRK